MLTKEYPDLSRFYPPGANANIVQEVRDEVKKTFPGQTDFGSHLRAFQTVWPKLFEVGQEVSNTAELLAFEVYMEIADLDGFKIDLHDIQPSRRVCNGRS